VYYCVFNRLGYLNATEDQGDTHRQESHNERSIFLNDYALKLFKNNTLLIHINTITATAFTLPIITAHVHLAIAVFPIITLR